jgi:hypothetical protein
MIFRRLASLTAAALLLCAAGPTPPPAISNLTATSPVVVTPSGSGGAARVLSCPTCATSSGITLTSAPGEAWDSNTAVTAGTFTFSIPWTSGTIASVKSATGGGGSFSVAVKKNGTNVTGCSSISVSGTSNTNTTCTATAVAANDQVSIVVSSPSGTVNTAYVQVVITHSAN